MNSQTIKKAGEIWAYMSTIKSQAKCDAIVICCSYDLRVCDHACDLIKQGFSNKLVISGKAGNWTRNLWDQSEALVFRERAIANGMQDSQLVIEPEATNFGENIRFSKALIPQAETVIFVSKPNSLLRVKLTVDAMWPQVNAMFSSPDIRFPDDVSEVIGLQGVISEMVGDIDRFIKYPSLGYQAAYSLPDYILKNWDFLKEQGFTDHLLATNMP